jgi:hypothetical protein
MTNTILRVGTSHTVLSKLSGKKVKSHGHGPKEVMLRNRNEIRKLTNKALAGPNHTLFEWHPPKP